MSKEMLMTEVELKEASTLEFDDVEATAASGGFFFAAFYYA